MKTKGQWPMPNGKPDCFFYSAHKNTTELLTGQRRAKEYIVKITGGGVSKGRAWQAVGTIRHNLFFFCLLPFYYVYMYMLACVFMSVVTQVCMCMRCKIKGKT